MEYFKDIQILHFETAVEWRDWLEQNCLTETSLWVKLSKKGCAVATITYEEARDTAIAYGWIDGLINRYDENFYLTRFTPRNPRSVWSKINCAVVESLIASGKMQPSGMVHVEAAKQDGRWDRAYDPQSKITVPDDFQLALNESPTALEFFAGINSSNRYAFLYRLQTAKTPDSRSALIKKFVIMLEERSVFHPAVVKQTV
jgi:uncharacterized protein YdeI (YjbR/CyaY-like superfamily)